MQVMQVMQADNANRAFRGNVAMQVHNLVDNFETKQCKWHHLMTKFWTSLQQIRKYTQKKYKSDFKKYNLKLRNMRASQLRFSSQTEQTLSTCVLILLLAGEITQVKEVIPWVRCASGNVSVNCGVWTQRMGFTDFKKSSWAFNPIRCGGLET